MRRSNGGGNATGSGRNKVRLKPGFSQLDWMRLMRSAKDPSGLGGQGPRVFTMAEVREHASVHDAWTVIKGRVYNITPYLHYHPGGVSQLMRGAGGDSTALFNEIHPWVALSMIDRLEIGMLNQRGGGGALPAVPEFSEDGGGMKEEEDGDAGDDAAGQRGATDLGEQRREALDPDQWRSLPLVRSKRVNHNTLLLRFSLGERQVSGLRPGQHVMVRQLVQRGTKAMEVQRQYTPVSGVDAVGFLDLLVKVYEDGKLTPRLRELRPGERLDFKGPFGALTYDGNMAFTVAGEQRSPAHLVMFAAGSGITPMLQLIKVMIREDLRGGPSDAEAASADAEAAAPLITLVYCNRSEEDIILRSDLEQLATGFGGRFRLHLVLSQPGAEDWGAPVESETMGGELDRSGMSHRGRVDAAIVGQVMSELAPENVLALTCGPDGFNEAVAGLLAGVGVPSRGIHTF